MQYLDKNGLKTYDTGIKKRIDEVVDKTYLVDKKRYRYHVSLNSDVADNSKISIGAEYKVGDDALEVYFLGSLLTKDEHYTEVGNTGTISNQIQIKSWGDTIDKGLYFDFIINGTYGSTKATKLAQIEYGIDNNSVYYTIDEKVSDSVYRVVVRNVSTTAALKYYKVNIETEEVVED